MDTTVQKLSDEQIVRKIRSYQRKVKWTTYFPVLLYFLPFILFVSSPFTHIFNSDTSVYFILGSVALIVLAVIITRGEKKAVKNMNRFVGDHVVKEIIEERIEIKKYVPDSFLKRSYIENSNIVPRYDLISGSDYIEGVYKGVELVYCDLELRRREEREHDGKKRHETITVFQGHFISLKMSKKMDGYVKIKERKNPCKKKGFFADVVEGIAGMVGIDVNKHKIEVESAAFNNQFEISTNNDEMAFYILTPQFMENIIKADALADGYTNIRFKGTDVDISINNGRDSFGIDKTMYSVKRLEESRDNMRRDLDVVLAIVDEILEKDRLFE